MVVSKEQISQSQAKQSKVEISKSESKAKLGFQNPEAKQSENFKIPKQSKAKQGGRQSKVGKVKAQWHPWSRGQKCYKIQKY